MKVVNIHEAKTTLSLHDALQILIYLNFPPETLDMVTTTQRHEIVSVDRIQTYGKDGTGDKLLDLSPDEELMFVN